MTRTICCRIPDELFQAVEEVCREKTLTITQAITAGLQKVCEGKIPLTGMRGKAVYCPVCGFALYPMFKRTCILWICAKCGFRGKGAEPEWRNIQKFEFNGGK